MSESGIRFIDPPEPHDRVIAAEISGHVTAADMRAYVKRIEAVVARGEKALVYQDMLGYDGVDVAAIAEKLKHIGTLWRGIEKAAIVGDRRWLEIYIGLADTLAPQELRYFPADQKAQAFAWLVE